MGRSSKTTTQSMPEFQEQFLSETLLPFATEFSQQEFTPYTGEMVAGVSPLSMGAQTQFGQIADIANMTPQDFAAMTQANMNPFQDQVIDAALARSQRERDIARTGEMADITRAGAFGNERRGVFEGERQAAFELGQNEMIANLMSQGYSQAQAQTMAQLGARQGAAGQAAAGMMQLGNLEQLTQQAGLDAQMQEFMRQQNMPLQQLGALVSAAGGVPAGYGTTTETKKPGFTDILGAVGSTGQALALISDRRLKTNVRKIGERDGIAFYSWDWNEKARELGAESHPTKGVIAQELAEIHPDLVVTGPHGFQMVNYVGLQERL
jgi:hypothetical protein